MADNVIKVSVTSTKSQRVSVSSSQQATNITASPDTGRFWAQTAKNWAVSENIVDNTDYSSKYYANESKIHAQDSQIYAQEASNVYTNFMENVGTSINEVIETKDSAITDINSTKTTILNDIEFVADGEKKEIEDLIDSGKDEIQELTNEIKDNAEDIINRVGISMFDTILKDHVLTYEESKGLALQGTYVYKEAIAGSRYGYPDFYNKCLEEYQNSSNTKQWLKSNVTYVGSVADNQGVLSGFSKSNYATFNIGSTSTSDLIEFVLSFNVGTWSSTTDEACGVVTGDTIPLIQIYNQLLNIGGTQVRGTYSYSVNEDVTWKITIQNGTLNIYRLNADNEFELDFTTSHSTAISGNVIIGYHPASSSDRWLQGGSVNLEECYIDINGQRQWTGADYITKNPNGHLFYDMSEKDKVDEIFASTGMAWMYGVDTENERIFLPRNNYFDQATGDTSEVGKSIEAGLPNINGTFSLGDRGLNLGGTGAFQTTSSRTNYVTASAANVGGAKNVSDFDASRSNPIYGNSDTVQPNAVKKLLYICVGNTETVSSVTDIIDVTTTENDTVPLFTGMYFDFTPNNVSWLKAGQQTNSSGIYTFTYNELVNIINGETKYGNLKVVNESDMIAGIDYSEYWKVNQDDMYFVTPTTISNKALSGAVVGNGMTLGLTDGGGNYCGLQAGSQGSFLNTLANYGLDLPSGGQGGGISITNSATGITTDPTKSGIIAEQSTAQLYFKVANAVQNLELLNAGEVLEAVNNVVPNNSSLIASYGIPDYSAMISVPTSFTAVDNGWVCYTLGTTSAGTAKVNGVDVAVKAVGSNYDYASMTQSFYVAKNDVVVLPRSGAFCPLKGAK